MPNTKKLLKVISSSHNNKIISRSPGKVNIFLNANGKFSLQSENLFTPGELKSVIKQLKVFGELNVRPNHPQNNIWSKAFDTVNDGQHIKIDFVNKVFSGAYFPFIIQELEKLLEPIWLGKEDKKNDFNVITKEKLPSNLKFLKKGSTIIVISE